ncbi:hypothetical protein SO802_001431 [Lithocarpus litseifolius]|uniref:Uncharacterized protein n=1 Tax=Lithocarpus litseifolius TaxID=425828 RepID=A0AAW2DUD5_9ROSI
MVGPTKRTWTYVCAEMLGIQIPNGPQTVLKGQKILIPTLVERIRQPLPPDANEIQVHQYDCCYILALLGDMEFLDKFGDRVGKGDVYKECSHARAFCILQLNCHDMARPAQLAVLNWFNEESYEYKFIKKALEDVDQFDRIDVPANDEAVNQTEIPNVGPSTSSVAPVTLH